MKSEREREREGKNLHSLVQSPRVNGQSGAGMKPRAENLPGLLTWMQRTHALEPFSVVFPHISGGIWIRIRAART